MANIRITVRNTYTGNEWQEEYDKPGIGDNGNLLQAEDWANSLIQWFNRTTRPGEPKRQLLKTELLGDSTRNHDWDKRTNGMSVPFRGRLVDVFECRRCGITGKKFSLQGLIKRDSKYKAKKYDQCHGKRI